MRLMSDASGKPAIEVRAATVADRGALLRLLGADLSERGIATAGGAQASETVERAVELALSSSSAAWLVVASSGGRGLGPGLIAGVLLANPAVSTMHGGAVLRVEA